MGNRIETSGLFAIACAAMQATASLDDDRAPLDYYYYFFFFFILAANVKSALASPLASTVTLWLRVP